MNLNVDKKNIFQHECIMRINIDRSFPIFITLNLRKVWIAPLYPTFSFIVLLLLQKEEPDIHTPSMWTDLHRREWLYFLLFITDKFVKVAAHITSIYITGWRNKCAYASTKRSWLSLTHIIDVPLIDISHHIIDSIYSELIHHLMHLKFFQQYSMHMRLKHQFFIIILWSNHLSRQPQK